MSLSTTDTKEISLPVRIPYGGRRTAGMEGGKQKAKGGRQKAEGGRRKAEGGRRKEELKKKENLNENELKKNLQEKARAMATDTTLIRRFIFRPQCMMEL